MGPVLIVLLVVFGPGIWLGYGHGRRNTGWRGVGIAWGATAVWGMAIWLILAASTGSLHFEVRTVGQIWVIAAINTMPFWFIGRLVQSWVEEG